MKKTLVTGNWAKLAQAKEILEPLGHEATNIKMDTPEIQAGSVDDVAAYSARWASEQLKCYVVKKRYWYNDRCSCWISCSIYTLCR